MSYSLTSFQNSEVPDKKEFAERVKRALEIQFVIFVFHIHSQTLLLIINTSKLEYFK